LTVILNRVYSGKLESPAPTHSQPIRPALQRAFFLCRKPRGDQINDQLPEVRHPMTISRIPIAERLWPKVDKSAGPDGCWLWTGAKKQGGYGKIGQGGSAGWVLAHRVAWEVVNGPIPHGMVVCHSCDEPSCVNPAHLWLGTQAQNLADMRAKDRHCSGEKMTQALLGSEAFRNRPLSGQVRPRSPQSGRFVHGA
jgi:hypothetical protein